MASVLLCERFFFFQAEDGIRDLVRSRGLGDVYKRQVVHRGESQQHRGEGGEGGHDEVGATHDGVVSRTRGAAPVSYTHLTLPTSDLV